MLLLLLDSGKKGLTRRESGGGSRTVTKDENGENPLCAQDTEREGGRRERKSTRPELGK